MDLELKEFLKSIKEQTNIDISVFTKNAQTFYSTCDDVFVAPSNDNFEGVFVDTETNKTYFKILYKELELIFYIDGVSVYEENYAKFISNMILNFASKELVLSRQEYLRAILLGECSKTQVAKYIQKFSAPDYKCYAILCNYDKHYENDILVVMDGYTTNSFDVCAKIDDGVAVYIKFIDENSDASYSSPQNFASFLIQTLKEETGKVITTYVGSIVAKFDDIKTSYDHAIITKDRARRVGIKKEVHTYSEYVFVEILETLPEQTLEQYYSVLLGGMQKNVLLDKELTDTATGFFDNNLNVSETARKLYIHRNTLMYRLDKIEKETGLDIRNLNDAFTFRLLMLLYKLKG